MLDNSKNYKDNEDIYADELNISYFLNFLIRNKFLISVITFLFFIFGTVYSLTKRRVWEGQFQIVLENDKRAGTTLNPALESISNISSQIPSEIQTQVGILESPSVLMPIFNYVNTEQRKSKNSKKNLNFKNWKNNQLIINLKKGTSILNIAYRDTNKNLIIPSLKKINEAYQDYSGKDKRISQNRTKNYLLEQISYFKIKSQQSLREAQGFAIDKDLINVNVADDRTNESILLKNSNLSLEENRIRAINNIRKIDLQIDKINQIGDDSLKLQYIGSTIPVLVKQGLPQSLESLEGKLTTNRLVYTEQDLEIQKLLEERKNLIDLMKKRAIGVLEANKLVQKAKLEAAMRPKDVLIKYKELVREASRDEAMLVKLEDQLSLLLLEIEKEGQPWELITQPTLLINPVAPSRKNFAIGSFIIGFFISLLISYYRELKSNLIFEKTKIEDLLEIPIIESLQKSDVNSGSEKIIFLKNLFSCQYKNDINLFLLGDLNLKMYEELQEILISDNVKSKNKDKLMISLTRKINEINSNDCNLILCDFNKIKFSEIKVFKNRIRSLKINFEGIILFENYES